MDRIVHFDFHSDSIVKSGCVHFGFHDRAGRHYAVSHEGHFIGLIGKGDDLLWTAAPRQVLAGVPNITAGLEYPMYVDLLLDETVVVSNFRSAQIYAADPRTMTARTLVDGHAIGMRDAGNCVVDDEGFIWVNEVTGCRVWRFDPAGQPVLTLGDGSAGFQKDPVDFADVRFNWIYDIRRAPGGNILVLDSRNYALRVIDTANRVVRTVAGTGHAGYNGDGCDALQATFGSDPAAEFDGPISLAADDEGNAYVGDRFNQVVRMIDRSGTITTLAGHRGVAPDQPNSSDERELTRLRLPQISSMDYHAGRLFIPTNLTSDSGDLIVLRANHTDVDS